MRPLLLVATFALLSSCGSVRAGPRARPGTISSESGFGNRAPEPLLPRTTKRAMLGSIPPTATFAWVPPSAVFAGLSAKEAATEHVLVAESKIDAGAVLRANGWRETAPESAQFRLSMVRVERTGQRTTIQPDPRNDRAPPRKCERGVFDVKAPCHEPATPNYPPIRTTTVYSVATLGYSIERVADGATAWWVTTQDALETRQFVARKTLELLLAVEKK